MSALRQYHGHMGLIRIASIRTSILLTSSDTAPRAVDVYMTKLRSKLADCEDFEIKTVHGLGYKAVLKQ